MGWQLYEVCHFHNGKHEIYDARQEQKTDGNKKEMRLLTWTICQGLATSRTQAPKDRDMKRHAQTTLL